MMFANKVQKQVCVGEKNICVQRPRSDDVAVISRIEGMGIVKQTTRKSCMLLNKLYYFIHKVEQSVKCTLLYIVYCILYIVNILTFLLTKYIFCSKGVFSHG